MRPPLLLAILSAIGCAERTEGTACLVMDTGTTTCPAPEDVDLDQLNDPWDCDQTVVEMVSTETPTPSTGVFQVAETVGCCYDVISEDTTPNSECVVGRPFLEEGALVLPDVPAVADPIAAGWLKVAAMEWASVAAFARLQLELLAHGAPPDLVTRVAHAMRDEVEHATRVRAHVEAIVGAPLPFGPMPLPRELHVQRPLADVAADAVREGCVGETISARLIAAAAARTEDGALATDLARIAADEEQHAVLSWAIVAWAMRVGGPEVRAAVAAAFAEPVPVGTMLGLDGAEGAGLLGPTVSAQVGQEVVRTIVAPAARALLAA